VESHSVWAIFNKISVPFVVQGPRCATYQVDLELPVAAQVEDFYLAAALRGGYHPVITSMPGVVPQMANVFFVGNRRMLIIFSFNVI
jgi:hypothetical protein